MNSNKKNAASDAIVHLEILKKKILQSQDSKEFETQVTNCIKSIFKVVNKVVSRKTELFAIVKRNVQHLEEIREAAIQSVVKEQLDALRYEASMAISVLQFTFWEKTNQELYDLLDKVEYQS